MDLDAMAIQLRQLRAWKDEVSPMLAEMLAEYRVYKRREGEMAQEAEPVGVAAAEQPADQAAQGVDGAGQGEGKSAEEAPEVSAQDPPAQEPPAEPATPA